VQRQEAERLAAEHAAQSRANVERSLRATYLLRKIAEKERIIVTETEVDSQIRAFASRQGWREERARSYMEERGMLRALRDDIRESKTEDFLVQHAHIKEIPPEEFAKKHRHEEVLATPDVGSGDEA
jgi:FKBP-type peptidyl-prolyl cis-trans isomerase (trigger factor)